MRGSVYKRCPCRDKHGRRVKGCKKSHGSWGFTLDVGSGPQAGRKQVSRSGFRTRDEAEEQLTAELAKVHAGTWTDDRGLTVSEWLNTWLSECVHHSPKTLANYRGHVSSLWIPRLGHLRLRDLRRDHIESALRDLAEPALGERPRGNVGRRVQERKHSTVDGYRRTLRTALSVAHRRGYITSNPARGKLDSIPRRTYRRKRAIWSPEDTARFLDTISTTRLAALYELAAYAGLRRGELCGLRWSDIDTDQLGLQVSMTLVEVSSQLLTVEQRKCPYCGFEHKGRLFKPPKSQAGDRWVPLADPARKALQMHRRAQAAERRIFGSDYSDHNLVFAAPDGTPLRPDNVTKEFNRYASSCGLPLINLHRMRHGACSLLLADGVPIEVVQMILGHSTPEVTRDIYAHVLRSETAEKVERASKLLSRHRQKADRPRPGANQTGAGSPSTQLGAQEDSSMTHSPRTSVQEIVERYWPYDAPAEADRTNAAATAVSALVRYLNNKTRDPATLPSPSDLDELTSNLWAATAGLDQLLKQLAARADSLSTEPGVYDDRDDRSGEATALAASEAFADVRALARRLAEGFEQVRAHTSHLGGPSTTSHQVGGES